MVDFSDEEGVISWLERINPEERRREVAVALAGRAALRVMPRVGVLGRKKRDSAPKSELILRSLQSAAIAWAEAKYPTHGGILGDAAVVARYARGADPNDFASFAAIYAAEVAAEPTLSKVASILSDAIGNERTAWLGDRLEAEADAARIDAGLNDPIGNERTARLGDQSEAEADAARIDAGGSASEVAGLPLWPKGAPAWASEAWQAAKSRLLAANEGWEVWTDWYEARLAGDADRPPNEALEIARATIPDEIWMQGPAVVNAEIKRLIAEHQSLQQRPAAFQFRVVDDKIDASPDDARPINGQDALDFYNEAKRKGRVLEDRLQRAQADEDIRAHIDLLLTRLGDFYSEMRPGLMVSVLRSLESDVRAMTARKGARNSAPRTFRVFSI